MTLYFGCDIIFLSNNTIIDNIFAQHHYSKCRHNYFRFLIGSDQLCSIGCKIQKKRIWSCFFRTNTEQVVHCFVESIKLHLNRKQCSDLLATLVVCVSQQCHGSEAMVFFPIVLLNRHIENWDKIVF